MCSSSRRTDPDTTELGAVGQPAWVREQCLVMALASAVLGPFCDGLHSSHDVLHYAQPSLLHLPGELTLETCW